MMFPPITFWACTTKDFNVYTIYRILAGTVFLISVPAFFLLLTVRESKAALYSSAFYAKIKTTK